jgi:hypothetical protein
MMGDAITLLAAAKVRRAEVRMLAKLLALEHG